VKAKSRPAAKRRTGQRKRARVAKTPSANKTSTKKTSTTNVLVVDVGGTSVKILATGQTERRSFPSGPTLTPRRMVSGVRKLAQGWAYDVVSIGYPGPVLHGRPMAEPYNLGRGWLGFDFAEAFG
jgi:polyphosphate glucokinase